MGRVASRSRPIRSGMAGGGARVGGSGGPDASGGPVGGKSIDIKVLIEIPVEAWIEDARGGSPDSLGMALEACRAYLEKIAEAELASDLRPKGDVSDLVQETFLEAARDFRQFTGCTGPEWQAWLRQIFI